MFNFRKLMSLVLVLAFVFCTTPAFSDARHGIQSSGPIETSTDAVLPAGSWLYGVKLYADAGSSWMAVYNIAAVAAGTPVTTIVEECGEATQYDSVEIWYPKPIYLSAGASVVISTGVGILYYGPPPD